LLNQRVAWATVLQDGRERTNPPIYRHWEAHYRGVKDQTIVLVNLSWSPSCFFFLFFLFCFWPVFNPVFYVMYSCPPRSIFSSSASEITWVDFQPH
jgi:hypothetical protein